MADAFVRTYGKYAGWAQTLLFIAELPSQKALLNSTEEKSPNSRKRKLGGITKVPKEWYVMLVFSCSKLDLIYVQSWWRLFFLVLTTEVSKTSQKIFLLEIAKIFSFMGVKVGKNVYCLESDSTWNFCFTLLVCCILSYFTFCLVYINDTYIFGDFYLKKC